MGLSNYYWCQIRPSICLLLQTYFQESKDYSWRQNSYDALWWGTSIVGYTALYEHLFLLSGGAGLWFDRDMWSWNHSGRWVKLNCKITWVCSEPRLSYDVMSISYSISWIRQFVRNNEVSEDWICASDAIQPVKHLVCSFGTGSIRIINLTVR